MKKTLLLTLFLGACASGDPLVDFKASETPENYHQDLLECEAIIDKRHSSLQEGLVDGALGAGVGALAAFGLYKAGVGVDSTTLGWAVGSGAAIGGLSSGVMSAGKTNAKKSDLLRTCLTGRGYKVIE